MGKTFFLMWLIYNRCGLGYKQYILDVEGKELNKLTYELGGANIDCSNGEKGRINPLQIRFNVPDSDTGDGKVPLDQIYPLEQHIRFLRSFLNAYKGDSDEIGILHTNLIERALTHVYGLINIDFKTTAQYILDNFKSEDYPIFSDVYDTIQQWLKEIEKQPHPDRAEIERHKVCLAFLEPIAYGADANLFNGHTNVDLSANVINFNLSALQDNTGSRVLATQYYNVLSYIWTDIISDPFNRRKQLYADEFSVIMDPRYLDIMMYFQTVIKRVRKYMAGLTPATQQISDVLKDSVKEQGEAIIENSVYQFYFGLGAEGIEYFKKTHLIPESEQEFVQFANIGECYAKIGTSTAMRVRIQIGDEAFNKFTRMKDDRK
jgi:type IV secretory pathway VirB4 component